MPSLRSDGEAIAAAIALTDGSAATLLPLVADMRDSRDVARSLVRLLRPGGALELICRRHYEVLLHAKPRLRGVQTRGRSGGGARATCD